MANETYTLIQKTTLNASAASITFSSIPQTFTDLVVMMSVRSANAADRVELYLTVNSDTAANYSSRRIQGYDSSSVLSAASSSVAPTSNASFGRITGATSTASTFSNVSLYIPNYTSSNQKSMSIDWNQENNSSTSWSVGASAVLYSGTAAITSLSFSVESSGTFAQYSSVSLYGVAKQGVTPVAGPKASGGDIITNDGTYWIHQFLNSGTFTPSQTLSCGYLVVAGGGGGGGNVAGGGGAGGLRSTVTATGGGGSLESALSVTAQAYTITVGAGGVAGDNTGTAGLIGSNSVFSTITSTGGGRGGGGNSNTIGGTGGSGGGGGAPSGTSPNGGTGTANQGFAGGTAFTSATIYQTGGGGGGAGAVGSAGVSGAAGNGGNGVAVEITGSSVNYAGGGGGGNDSRNSGTAGNGGSGGGGAGSTTSATGTAGSTNTGGGGGGGAYITSPGATAGGAGGSGIVIIRYAI